MTNSTDERYEEILDHTLSYWWGEGKNPIDRHLTYIGEVDLSEPDYSFDLLRFYVRKHDGMVLYATDSGCSCPSPFEDTRVGDLKETTVAGVEAVARAEAHDDYGVPVLDVVSAVRVLIPAMREAGAR